MPGPFGKPNTNQRETTLLWDRQTGKPIANAIVWQDRRTAKECDRLRTAGKAPLIRRKTGLVIDAYFSATKITWLLKNIKGARTLAQKGRLAFGTMDSWLIWKLTDGTTHVTDASNASRTMLFNLRTGDWDHRRHRGRPAGRPLRPMLHSARHGEKHLRHRLLHAHAHRRETDAVKK
jgi:glycerol kinase